MLRDVGLITCDHGLGTATYAFQANSPSRKYPVRVIIRNATIDVAILEIDAPDPLALEPGEPDTARTYDQITLLGFPNYRLGDTDVSIRGEIIGFRSVSTTRRMLISAPIVAGNSGGPVLDAKNRAIGIAVTGSDSFDTANSTENHGVIPITALGLIAPPSQQ